MGQTKKKQESPPFLYENFLKSAWVNPLNEFTSTIFYKNADFAIQMQKHDQSPIVMFG